MGKILWKQKITRNKKPIKIIKKKIKGNVLIQIFEKPLIFKSGESLEITDIFKIEDRK